VPRPTRTARNAFSVELRRDAVESQPLFPERLDALKGRLFAFVVPEGLPPSQRASLARFRARAPALASARPCYERARCAAAVLC
jgi:hypothetical protein